MRRLEARGIAIDKSAETQASEAPEPKRGKPFGFGKIFAGGVVAVFALAWLQSQSQFLTRDLTTSNPPTAVAATSPAMSTPPRHFDAVALKGLFKENNLRAESDLKGKIIDVSGSVGNVKYEYGHIQVTLAQNYEWNSVFYGTLADDQKHNAISLSSGDLVTLRCVLQDTFLDTPGGESCVILP